MLTVPSVWQAMEPAHIMYLLLIVSNYLPYRSYHFAGPGLLSVGETLGLYFMGMV